MDWTAPGPGAVNQLWRMNLHYMEYLEAVDDADFEAIIGDWLDANASPKPGAWRDAWNAYALSLRVVVWLQQLQRRGDRLPSVLIERIEASAASQLLYLEHNLETDLGGNHLVKNIKALLWSAAYFDGMEAARWHKRGLALLAKELGRQILSDGMHHERSPSYHCQVFADLLEVRHALGLDPLGGALDDALTRMAQVAVDLAHPDGEVALFNDAGLTMAYRPEDCLAPFEFLIGCRPVPRAVFAMPEAGYYGLRAGATYLVADCGRIAPDDLPAHGHGDVLSFEWSAGGSRIVVDQGVFEYVAGTRRQASRAAGSHNTLSLDGADQADFFGAFRCGRRPNVMVRRWEPRAEGFVLEGAHDGFTRLSGAPRHVRRVEASSAGVVVHDRIEGSTDRTARMGFLLHPQVACESVDRSIVLRRGGISARLNSTVPLAIEPAVWWPDMGRELATWRIVGTLPAGVREARTELAVVNDGD